MPFTHLRRLRRVCMKHAVLYCLYESTYLEPRFQIRVTLLLFERIDSMASVPFRILDIIILFSFLTCHISIPKSPLLFISNVDITETRSQFHGIYKQEWGWLPCSSMPHGVAALVSFYSIGTCPHKPSQLNKYSHLFR